MQAFVIDAFSFCQHHEKREGSTKIADFARLSAECAAVDAKDLMINWSLQGNVDKLGLTKLVLTVTGKVPLVCQRCLTPFEFELDSQSELILAKNEEHADEIEAMLEDDEIDVVVGSKTFNVMDLIEDEALLAIPQSPKHAVCPDVVLVSSDLSVAANNVDAEDAVSTSGKVSPFAVLKKLI
ncbi:MAG: DUF177 domain-containing protein [Undibacterium sp.]|nr:DUF177 domain-containing protein [Undibacterium sp.]